MKCDVSGCDSTETAQIQVIVPAHGEQAEHLAEAFLCSSHQTQYDDEGFIPGLVIPDDREKYAEHTRPWTGAEMIAGARS